MFLASDLVRLLVLVRRKCGNAGTVMRTGHQHRSPSEAARRPPKGVARLSRPATRQNSHLRAKNNRAETTFPFSLLFFSLVIFLICRRFLSYPLLLCFHIFHSFFDPFIH